MPEEVRRSSVQSRRASLAAGRRKSQQQAGTNQPDWEVEAPPTPPAADDYSPRQPGTRAVQPVQPAEPVEPAKPAEPQPEQNEEEQPREAAAEPVANEEEEQPAAEEPQVEEGHDVAADSLVETDEEVEGVSGADGGAAHETKKQKTRHTIRFRGPKWQEEIQTQQEEIKQAFLEDIWDAAKVKAEDTTKLKVSWEECMVITFVMLHAKGLKKRQKQIHQKLEEYKFPKVCALYPALEDE